MGAFDLAAGEKYGLIALPRCLLARDLPEEVQVAPDLWVSRKLAIQPSQHWKEWLGSVRFKALGDADLVLIARRPSKEPTVLDQENKDLQDRAYKFYWGLLLSEFTRIDGRPLTVSGAHRDGEVDVRTVADLESVWWPHGIEHPPVSEDRLKEAAALATALAQMPSPGKYGRFWRITHAFYDGIRSPDPGRRIHEFVRSVEGFILPDPGKTERQFKSRTELFVGTGHHALAEHLFKIRSAVEHLHGPEREVNGATPRDRGLVIMQRAVEAEALARYCIRHLLLNRPLWTHFEDDSALANFWALEQAARSTAWGRALDMNAITRRFKPDLIPDPE